jgi:hypothetical protein
MNVCAECNNEVLTRIICGKCQHRQELEDRVYWLNRAGWWFGQAAFDLEVLKSPPKALREFIRGLRCLAWGLGSEDRLKMVE